MTSRQIYLTIQAALILCMLFVLAGCTVVSATSSAVAAYCAVPNPARQANRILVNATIAPNSVAITCADGAASTSTTTTVEGVSGE